MGRGKNVLIGVTGGIAAYKIPDLVRRLKRKNINVFTAMTKTAERFVTPATLHAVSGNRPITANWDLPDDPMEHLEITKKLDLMLVAPATANFVAKMAGGLADDPLLTLSLAVQCPFYVAPSMNPRMYANIAVKENLAKLSERGVHVIRPDVGDMACGEQGEGRLPEIDRLVAIVEHALGLESDLEGKKVVVTTGRTEEPVDSVRFLSNRSSGKMGMAIAVAARDRGADVTLIHGSVSEPLPENVESIAVRSAQDMHEAAMRLFHDCDVMITAAAVADFKPAHIYDTKIKKDKAELTIPLAHNPDILESLGRAKQRQILVGFAAETENFLANAREKLIRKNADLICVNDVSRSDIGFDSDYNEVSIVSRTGDVVNPPRLTKREIAQKILDEVVELAQQQEKKSAARDG